jgi:hypothetical protein
MLTPTARALAAASLLLGPVLFAVAEFASPDVSGSPDQMLAAIAADRAGITVSIVASLLSAFFLITGVFLLGRRPSIRGRVLIGAGTGVILWAMLTNTVLLGVNIMFLSMTDPSLDPGQMAKLLDALNANPLAAVVLTGHYVLVVGAVLLGLGLWRAHIGPVWAAVFIAVCGLVDAVGDFFGPVGGVVGGGVSDAMLIVGFGAVGWFLLRDRRESSEAVTSRADPALQG